MKSFNDFNDYQEYVDYIKVNDVVTNNNLLEFVAYTNKITDNTYNIEDVIDYTELEAMKDNNKQEFLNALVEYYNAMN